MTTKKKAIAAIILSTIIITSIGLSACNTNKYGAVPQNDFHTPVQYAYLNDRCQNIAAYANGDKELSRPNAIVLDYSYVGQADSYTVEYADNLEFNDSVVINNVKENRYGVYNLQLGQELYWRAATSTDEIKNAETNHMTIATKTPRNLYIDGVTNVRDVGGYDSYLVKGAKIRQGLYFRGAALDSHLGGESELLITEQGQQELLRLGVKEEIDLRDSVECNGPYVSGIKYNAISIPAGTESTRFEAFEDEYKKIFTILANADKAPVYLHCSAGADRTGICTFMLLSVCGVSYSDLVKDYLFTNFSTHGKRMLNSEFDVWCEKLNQYSGSTKADKTKNWLISKGISEDVIERIREIFVEGYTASVR